MVMLQTHTTIRDYKEGFISGHRCRIPYCQRRRSVTSSSSRAAISVPSWARCSETVEHPFGTIKCWMGYTHFQMKTLARVGTEMALHVLAYNLKRVMKIIGIAPLIAAIAAA